LTFVEEDTGKLVVAIYAGDEPVEAVPCEA
jgi:hypothetical protein